MGNIAVTISPRGVDQKDLVDLLYMIASSIVGICKKLDADGSVTLTTYTANCCTAIMKTDIMDSKGNQLMTLKTAGNATILTGINKFITPYGCPDNVLVEAIYELLLAWKTLMTQCDTDSLGSSDYVAGYWTATILQNVINKEVTAIGNGTVYYFGPNSMPDIAHLVELLFSFVDSIRLATAHLDADSSVADTNYAALWYTANILMMIENSIGSTTGITKPY